MSQPWEGNRDNFGGTGSGLVWMAVQYGDQAIQELVAQSVIERVARTEPMNDADVKQVPRLTGFDVTNVAKGTAYSLNETVKDRLEIVARKVGGAVKIAEEDLEDTQSDPLAAYRVDGAGALAKQLDNSCLAVTGDPNGTTVKYRSVWKAVNSTPDTFDTEFGYANGDNYAALDKTVFIRPRETGGTPQTNGYDTLSDLLSNYEVGPFFADEDTVVIAHPAYKNLMRGMKNASGDALMPQVGVNPVTGRPRYEVFGYPVEFSVGAKTSDVDTQKPTGNPLLIIGNRRLLIRGPRALSPQIPADTFGVALQRSGQGVGFLTDEAFLKVAYRRAFGVGSALAFVVLEVDLSA